MNIVAIDYGAGDKINFILNSRAYANLASSDLALELFSYGMVDVEYGRISCQHPGYNLTYKVTELANIHTTWL